ncbi:hypothetical protein [Miltoncostaea oceani]|uniref:hypothetical protein n=1 Tax=Miltoncostaea oceani TaxID=2843216 RepID=UPI001C3CAFDE|nr:hypothetical protein [Miltoncostaea oceani]
MSYLRAHLGRQRVEAIAEHLGLDVHLLIHQARILGIRRPVRLWPAELVEAGLRLPRGGWPQVEAEGIDRFRITDRQGALVADLVSSTSLARWLEDRNAEHLEAEGRINPWFRREIMESMADLQRRLTHWEGCRFLSPGHVCESPLSNSHGCFCTDNGQHAAGADPKCLVRHLSVHETIDQARRGAERGRGRPPA